MTRPVVVGVDGSSSSQAALGAAVAEARLRGTTVRAIHAWDVPSELFADGFAPTPDELKTRQEAAQKLLDEAVSRFADDPDVQVEPVLVRAGSASRVLVAESSAAALLVVGARGLHGLRELVLGSVSHTCCRDAHCPVLVLPAGAQTTSPAAGVETAASY